MSSIEHRAERVRLKNGADGLLIHVPKATVMAQIFNFRAGFSYADESKWETPHIMEHMAFGANSRYPKARRFQAEFEKNGAYCNAFTNDNNVWYETECADIEWERILDLMILSISEPSFLKDEFEAECGNVKDELIARSNNRGQFLSIELSRQMGLRTHQYMQRVELMNNVQLKDILHHYKCTHTSSNLQFIIAGKLTDSRKKKLLDRIENMPLPKGNGLMQLPIEKANSLSTPLYIKKEDVPNTYLEIVSYADGKFDEKNWVAASIVTSLLTGTLFSKILGEAREKGLVYGMSSNFTHNRKLVGWWLSCQAQPDNLIELMNITRREVGKILEGRIDKSDIDAARQMGIGSFQRHGQTVYSIAKAYSGLFLFEGVVEDYFGFPDKIRALDKQDLVDVMRSTIEASDWGLGILGAGSDDLARQLSDQVAPLWQIK